MGTSKTPPNMLKWRFFLTFFSTFFLLSPSTHSGEAFPTEARVYYKTAEGILIAKGVCKEPRECSHMNLVFWEGGNPWIPSLKRVFISLYDISDEALIDDVAMAIKELKRQTAGPPFTLTAYKSSHRAPKIKLKEIKVD